MLPEQVVEFLDLKTSTSPIVAKDANTTILRSREFNKFNNCKCVFVRGDGETPNLMLTPVSH